jgi:hypothetical protein
LILSCFVGATVPLPLDLVEMGMPADLRAKVVAVEPCPPIRSGSGSVVLTTVDHLNPYVMELTVADQRGREEKVRPTGYHKFYSATRRAWVSTEDLRPGESLQGVSGPLHVVALSRLPGTHRVYNMTVEDEHVYNVAMMGVLVHNNECKFGSIQFGNEMHDQFYSDLSGQTGTNLDDWRMNTGPGQTGVDAEWVGPDDRNPGFNFAELKPATESGFNTFENQMERWNLPEEETQLWGYDADGNIFSTGENF